MKNIVILGSSYGGLGTAHKLLQQAPKTGDVKIILVSPNTHLYWNIAAPRAILPGQFTDDKLFGAIAPGFKKYTPDRFEFVVGTAERLNLESKSVVVATETGEKTISYDILVLATGSRTKEESPFKPRGSYEATRNTLHDFQNKIKNADSITIVGAGSTGVETAGELGYEYGKQKKITLIASGAHVLEGTPAGVTKAATTKLKELNVTVKTSTKVLGSAKLPDGRTEVSLSDGQKIVTDVYIFTGGLTPNSSYVPQNLLNANGFVLVDEFLRVKGTTDVWAVGDISSIQRPQVINTGKQAAHVVKNIGLSMTGKNLAKYPTDGGDMMVVPLGKKAGTGHMGSWKFPSFMVVFVKGKTYFTQNLTPTINGTA